MLGKSSGYRKTTNYFLMWEVAPRLSAGEAGDEERGSAGVYN